MTFFLHENVECFPLITFLLNFGIPAKWLCNADPGLNKQQQQRTSIHPVLLWSLPHRPGHVKQSDKHRLGVSFGWSFGILLFNSCINCINCCRRFVHALAQLNWFHAAVDVFALIVCFHCVHSFIHSFISSFDREDKSVRSGLWPVSSRRLTLSFLHAVFEGDGLIQSEAEQFTGSILQEERLHGLHIAGWLCLEWQNVCQSLTQRDCMI